MDVGEKQAMVLGSIDAARRGDWSRVISLLRPDFLFRCNAELRLQGSATLAVAHWMQRDIVAAVRWGERAILAADEPFEDPTRAAYWLGQALEATLDALRSDILSSVRAQRAVITEVKKDLHRLSPAGLAPDTQAAYLSLEFSVALSDRRSVLDAGRWLRQLHHLRAEAGWADRGAADAVEDSVASCDFWWHVAGGRSPAARPVDVSEVGPWFELWRAVRADEHDLSPNDVPRGGIADLLAYWIWPEEVDRFGDLDRLPLAWAAATVFHLAWRRGLDCPDAARLAGRLQRPDLTNRLRERIDDALVCALERWCRDPERREASQNLTDRARGERWEMLLV